MKFSKPHCEEVCYFAFVLWHPLDDCERRWDSGCILIPQDGILQAVTDVAREHFGKERNQGREVGREGERGKKRERRREGSKLEGTQAVASLPIARGRLCFDLGFRAFPGCFCICCIWHVSKFDTLFPSYFMPNSPRNLCLGNSGSFHLGKNCMFLMR